MITEAMITNSVIVVAIIVLALMTALVFQIYKNDNNDSDKK